MIKKIILATILILILTAIYNGMPVSNQLVDKCTIQSVYCD